MVQAFRGGEFPLHSAVRMHLLLLWDIDGTLIASGGAGMHALQAALQAEYGVAGSLADIDFAGRFGSGSSIRNGSSAK